MLVTVSCEGYIQAAIVKLSFVVIVPLDESAYTRRLEQGSVKFVWLNDKQYTEEVNADGAPVAGLMSQLMVALLVPVSGLVL